MTIRRPVTPRGEALLVAAGFVAVHAVLVVEVFLGPDHPIGDVTSVYQVWLADGFGRGLWHGIDTASVYPVLALLPMVVANLLGAGHIVVGWLALMIVLDAVAAVALWRLRVAGQRAVRWWLGFLVLLGPVSIGRIDTVAVVLGLVAVAVVARRPAAASALFTAAAWIKVWPAALVGVLLARPRRRLAVVVGAMGVTLVVVGVDVALGGGSHLLAFVDKQTGRGVTPASVLATPFMWMVASGASGVEVLFDSRITVFQVSAPGAGVVADLSTVVMVVLVLLVAAFLLRARRRGVPFEEVGPLAAMAFVAALVVSDKVGSPQYLTWFAVPVVWGLTAGTASAQRFRRIALLMLPIALLSQVLYPWLYTPMLDADPAVLLVLTARNVLEVVVLVWTFVALGRLARRTGPTTGRTVTASVPTTTIGRGRFALTVLGLVD